MKMIPDMLVVLCLLAAMFTLWSIFKEDWLKEQTIIILGIVYGALRANAEKVTIKDIRSALNNLSREELTIILSDLQTKLDRIDTIESKSAIGLEKVKQDTLASDTKKEELIKQTVHTAEEKKERETIENCEDHAKKNE